MFYPFCMVNNNIEKIKSGKDFVVWDSKFMSGKINLKCIPEDWTIQFMGGENILIGRKDHTRTHLKEVYAMLVTAAAIRGQSKFASFLKGLGLHT